MRLLSAMMLMGLLAIFATPVSADGEAKQGKQNGRNKQKQLPDLTAEDVFKVLDTNKNNKLGWEEFKNFIGIPHGKNGITGAAKDARELGVIFKRLDANDDKFLTLEEFQAVDTASDKKEERKGEKKKEK